MEWLYTLVSVLIFWALFNLVAWIMTAQFDSEPGHTILYVVNVILAVAFYGSIGLALIWGFWTQIREKITREEN